jgi:hypothetical protein
MHAVRGWLWWCCGRCRGWVSLSRSWIFCDCVEQIATPQRCVAASLILLVGASKYWLLFWAAGPRRYSSRDVAPTCRCARKKSPVAILPRLCHFDQTSFVKGSSWDFGSGAVREFTNERRPSETQPKTRALGTLTHLLSPIAAPKDTFGG